MRVDRQVLQKIEGHVGVALRNGKCIDDAELVSAGRLGAESLWLFVNGADVFAPHTEVLRLWQVDGRRRRSLEPNRLHRHLN
jgi:hypothetical protein